MKMNLAPLEKPSDGRAASGPAPADEPTGYRRLKFNELVTVGDYVIGKNEAFEPWDGPRGFQAGSFNQAIYRRDTPRSKAVKKTNN